MKKITNYNDFGPINESDKTDSIVGYAIFRGVSLYMTKDETWVKDISKAKIFKTSGEARKTATKVNKWSMIPGVQVVYSKDLKDAKS